MRITVVGTGYVGLVAGVCFAEMGNNVTCIDNNENKIKNLKKGISPIYEKNLTELMRKNHQEKRLDYSTDSINEYKTAKIIFIGVGTPENEDGSANLKYLEEVSLQIAKYVENDCVVIIKSTVPVGTNAYIEKLIKTNLTHNVNIEVASNPEFLAQGNAVENTLKPNRIIIGTNTNNAETILKKLYEPLNAPIVSVDRETAEMIKYASNDFLAMKISYMNEIANLCEVLGADIDGVREGMSYDDRIGNKFLKAGIGYGGSCFPKDTKALKYLADSVGCNLKLVTATIEVNNEQKTKLLEKAKRNKHSVKGKKISVLGLTFKPETDDLREAPALDNIKCLLEEGAIINVFDPVGIKNAKKILGETINYCSTIEETLKDTEICFVFTEWNIIQEIKPSTFKKLMKKAIVYDGRNIYNPTTMKENDVEYYKIG